MNSPFFNGDIFDIAEQSSSRLGIRLRAETARLLTELSPEERVADATSAYSISGATKCDDCVIIVSSAKFPDAVATNTMGALRARSLLGDVLGKRICVPLLAERWQGRSYALYSQLSGFSESRLLRRAQKLRATPAIIDWLQAGFRQTAVERTDADLQSLFLDPLAVILNDDGLAARTRSTAQVAERELSAGKVRLVTCLEHCDFWTGNIMFDKSAIPGLAPFTRDFRVIDWGGSLPEGHAGIDAVRYLLSAFGPSSQSKKWAFAYCKAAGLSLTDFSVSCLCALGRIGADLNHFPRAHFVSLVEGVHDFLARSGCLDGLLQPARTV